MGQGPTWFTLFLVSSQPIHINAFSPVDSLNKAMLEGEGVNDPAAKYSVVCSGQNAMEDIIPTCRGCVKRVGGRLNEGGVTFQTILRLL